MDLNEQIGKIIMKSMLPNSDPMKFKGDNF